MARWQYLGGSSRELPLYGLFVVPGDVVDCSVCPDAVLFADAGVASVTASLTFPATAVSADGVTLTVRGGRAKSTAYAVNDAVCHDGVAWRCVSPYVSGTSDYFNPAQAVHWARAPITNTPPGSSSSVVGLAEKHTIRSHVVIEMNADSNAYTFPARIRPVEPSRKLVIVENIGTTVIQLAYGTLGNVSWSTPVTAQWTAGPTLQPGQAWRDTGTAQSLFMRPFTSGQSAAIGVYTELGVL